MAVNKLIRSQVAWWIRATWLGQSWSPLVDVRCSMPLTCIRIYADAAGGSPSTLNGLGGVVCLDDPVYFYCAWPNFIQNNIPFKDGTKFARKLTFLETLALLAGVLAAPITILSCYVLLTTDNSGAFYAALKGHSRCKYTYSAMKALHDVCAGLGAGWKVDHQPRRVDGPSCVADELSKGRVVQARDLMQDLGFRGVFRFANLARTFLAFLENPEPTRVLGIGLLKELSSYMEVAPASPEWAEEVDPLVHYSICPDLQMY